MKLGFFALLLIFSSFSKTAFGQANSIGMLLADIESKKEVYEGMRHDLFNWILPFDEKSYNVDITSCDAKPGENPKVTITTREGQTSYEVLESFSKIPGATPVFDGVIERYSIKGQPQRVEWMGKPVGIEPVHGTFVNQRTILNLDEIRYVTKKEYYKIGRDVLHQEQKQNQVRIGHIAEDLTHCCIDKDCGEKLKFLSDNHKVMFLKKVEPTTKSPTSSTTSSKQAPR
jgi:hypothetical protein